MQAATKKKQRGSASAEQASQKRERPQRPSQATRRSPASASASTQSRAETGSQRSQRAKQLHKPSQKQTQQADDDEDNNHREEDIDESSTHAMTEPISSEDDTSDQLAELGDITGRLGIDDNKSNDGDDDDNDDNKDNNSDSGADAQSGSSSKNMAPRSDGLIKLQQSEGDAATEEEARAVRNLEAELNKQVDVSDDGKSFGVLTTEYSSEDDVDTDEEMGRKSNAHSGDDGANDKKEKSVSTQGLPAKSTSGVARTIPLKKNVEVVENLAEQSDSDDEKGHRNRIGNVPLEWYKDLPHIGYNIQGKAIVRKQRGDQIDQLLSRSDDPNYWKTVYDELNDEHIKLSEKELSVIRRIRKGQYPHAESDPYPDFEDIFTSKKRVESLGNGIEPKRRFIPSKWEAKMIVKLVNAIRNGWLKIKDEEEPEEKDNVYLLWGENETPLQRKGPPAIPPPKQKLPGHVESYNPPGEYLPTQEEINAWELLDPEERPYNFTPQKYDALRKVPLYDNFIKERFERCLDLYLCPRTQKKRLNIDPESLIPKLPKPQELRPFPTTLALEFIGHNEKVRTISVSPDGQWLVSGSDDGFVMLWETSTGRCFRKWNIGEVIDTVAWNPVADIPLIAVTTGSTITILHTLTATREVTAAAEELLNLAAVAPSARAKPMATWQVTPDAEHSFVDLEGKLSVSRLVVEAKQRIRSLVWHHKGDYMATVSQELSSSTLVLIHRVSKKQSQSPFSKSKGLVQRVAFHPTKPFFFLATQRHVRIYNLIKQSLVKKLICPARWISSIAVHPSGDHIIVGSYDRRVCWYDLDLSSSPFKTLKYHQKAVRAVSFHPKYPLFASSSDDGKLHIFHATVYDDFVTNPLIVPVKIIAAHELVDDLGILDCCFHPTQPFIFSAGADRVVRLFTT